MRFQGASPWSLCLLLAKRAAGVAQRVESQRGFLLMLQIFAIPGAAPETHYNT